MNEKPKPKLTIKTTAREVARLAVFVALVIAAQLALAFVVGVEVVTLLFVTYAFTFGVRRGTLAATAFSLLRQLLFGFYPNVLLLYLTYYNGLTLCFGFLGGKVKNPLKNLWWLTLTACLCTVCFTLLDDVITPLWYGYTAKAARAYRIASLNAMLPQVVCTGVTVGILFIPLYKAFCLIKRKTP